MKIDIEFDADTHLHSISICVIGIVFSYLLHNECISNGVSEHQTYGFTKLKDSEVSSCVL